MQFIIALFLNPIERSLNDFALAVGSGLELSSDTWNWEGRGDGFRRVSVPPPSVVLEISSVLLECDTRHPEGSAHGMVTLCVFFEYFGCQNRVQLLLGQWLGSRAVAVAICISTKLLYLNFAASKLTFRLFSLFFHYFLLVPAFFTALTTLPWSF